MKLYLTFLLGMAVSSGWSQPNDTIRISTQSKVSSLKPNNTNLDLQNATSYKPEIFTSGFIDVINNGQINASARFIRLSIGEPGKFAVPLSFYSGVSTNNFQNNQANFSQRSNDVLVTNFINPLSGLANISTDGINYFDKKSKKVTKVGLLYHFGERILTGIRTGSILDPQTGKPINFLNSFGSIGFYFQTGAWDRNNNKNVGVSWFALRYIACYSNPNQLKAIIPTINTNGLYHGYSIAWGVDISSLVNIKTVFYKYVKKPEINYYLPIYQFSFNYSVRK